MPRQLHRGREYGLLKHEQQDHEQNGASAGEQKGGHGHGALAPRTDAARRGDGEQEDILVVDAFDRGVDGCDVIAVVDRILGFRIDSRQDLLLFRISASCLDGGHVEIDLCDRAEPLDRSIVEAPGHDESAPLWPLGFARKDRLRAHEEGPHRRHIETSGASGRRGALEQDVIGAQVMAAESGKLQRLTRDRIALGSPDECAVASVVMDQIDPVAGEYFCAAKVYFDVTRIAVLNELVRVIPVRIVDHGGGQVFQLSGDRAQCAVHVLPRLVRF